MSGNGDRLAPWIAYLASPDAPADAMRPLELDGFLTGIIVSPDLIHPTEWVAVIWGEDGPQVEEIAQAQKLFECITGHYNDIIERLDDEQTEFRPMFVGADGVAAPDRLKPWITGFAKAIAFSVDDWEERGRADPDFDMLTSPILAAAEILLRADEAIPRLDERQRELVALIPRVLPLLLDRVRQPPPKQPSRRAAPRKRNRKPAPS